MEAYLDGNESAFQVIQMTEFGNSSCNHTAESNHQHKCATLNKASGIRKSFRRSKSSFWTKVTKDTQRRRARTIEKMETEIIEKQDLKLKIKNRPFDNHGNRKSEKSASTRSQDAESSNHFSGSIHLHNNDTLEREEENRSLNLIYDPNDRKDNERSKNESIHSKSCNTVMMDAAEMKSIEQTNIKEKKTSRGTSIWRSMEWFMQTRIGALLFRFLPIITTLWSLTDVAFDALQAKEYYDYATVGIKNCSTNNLMSQNWTNHDGTIETLNFNKISMNYFIISIVTFVLPPLLGISLYYIKFGRFGMFGDKNKVNFYKHKQMIENRNSIVRLTYILLIIPIISVIRNFIGYYILLPYFSLYFSGKLMWYGKIDSEEKITFPRLDMYFTPGLLPFYTLVEQLGEAGPQILLAIVCLVNNSQCTELYNYDVLGTSMGHLVISLFFSFGSFLIGTFKGIVAGLIYLRRRKEERRTKTDYANVDSEATI